MKYMDRLLYSPFFFFFYWSTQNNIPHSPIHTRDQVSILSKDT